MGLIGLSVVTFDSMAKASNFSWVLGEEPTGLVHDDLPAHNTAADSCTKQKVLIGNLATAQNDVCVYQADGFRYGILDSLYGYGEKSFVISFPNENRMYKVEGLPTNHIVYTKSKHLVYSGPIPNNRYIYGVYMIKNLVSQLTRVTNSDLSTSYRVKDGAAKIFIQNENGGGAGVNAAGVSDNGRWVVFELRPGGFVRIDMKTFEINWFLRDKFTYGYGMDPDAEFAISDDGRHVFVAGQNIDPFIADIGDGCGKTLTIFQEFWRGDTSVLTNPCPEKNLQGIINRIAGGDTRTMRFPRLDSEGGELTILTQPYYREVVEYKEKWVTLTAAGYVPPMLDYLAMGDSYSSGEGDTAKNPDTKQKYYRNYTDNEEKKSQSIPREKCHISTRSYPYLLAQGMGLSLSGLKRWNSVACSGATAWAVKEQGSLEYKGQEDRLKGYDYDKLKSQALNEFIPGRQKQIEFVKKYQPKVITLTMGGNDVDFGGKIEQCAKSKVVCDVAGLPWRSKLKYELTNKYDELLSLYKDLYIAGGSKSKIYILGYPQFINDEPGADCKNIYNLDDSEREMITNSVTYFNNVIEQAAKAAGVKYVDIENSLGNHKLCDSDTQHVTAITNIFGLNGNESQEGFHPNALGHIDIARAVRNKLNGYSLLDYDTCPNSPSLVCPDGTATKNSIDLPDYFKQTSETKNDNNIHYSLSSGVFIKNKKSKISAPPYTFLPNSLTKAVARSEPVELGSFMAASDGSIDVDVIIPDSVPAGFHTLLMTGQSYSGEPIELYQVIEISGANPSDIDEDGVNDSMDQCAYIDPVNIDQDLDGIDDACDSEISQIFVAIDVVDARMTANNDSLSGKNYDIATEAYVADFHPTNHSIAPDAKTLPLLKSLAVDKPALLEELIVDSNFTRIISTVVIVATSVVAIMLIFNKKRSKHNKNHQSRRNRL